jgi:hypothetical protein
MACLIHGTTTDVCAACVQIEAKKTHSQHPGMKGISLKGPPGRP